MDGRWRTGRVKFTRGLTPFQDSDQTTGPLGRAGLLILIRGVHFSLNNWSHIHVDGTKLIFPVSATKLVLENVVC